MKISIKRTVETIENCHERLQHLYFSGFTGVTEFHRRLPPSTADQGSTESRRWIIGDSEQPSEFSRRK